MHGTERLTSIRRVRIALVIPTYKPGGAIFTVIAAIDSVVTSIYVVDDACPENTGQRVAESVTDPRVKVLFAEQNTGVGGATKLGFLEALSDKNDIIVKLDSDVQMDPRLIRDLINPIVSRKADYVKGNRFFSRDTLEGMPRRRLVGNFFLSFMSKFSTGYWNVSDPTNGFFAIHADVLRCMDWQKTADRFFFESDFLFRLRLIDATVRELPMRARYQDEVSNLNPVKEIPRFLAGHLLNMVKRIGYLYYLRGFSKASVLLPLGLSLTSFSVLYGGVLWAQSLDSGLGTPVGSVMLVVLTAVFGVQFLLDSISDDISMTPQEALISGSRSRLNALLSLRRNDAETP
jgi:dolichol-phosphate mannosyltransferase